MKDKTISEWYPTEAKILYRVIKLKGGKIHQNDFDRIFSSVKVIDRGRGVRPRYKHHMRCLARLYFGLIALNSPIMCLAGRLEHQFLALAQDMHAEGKLNITCTTKGVFYSIPTPLAS